MKIDHEQRNGHLQLIVTSENFSEDDFLYRLTTPKTTVTFHYYQNPSYEHAKLEIRKEL